VPTAAGYPQRHPARDLAPKPHAHGPVALPGVEVYQTKPNNGTNHFESHRSHRLLNPSKLSQSAFLLKHQQMNMLVF
jgi:hypothetical protein